MKKLIPLTLLLCLTSLMASAQSVTDRIHTELSELFEASELPGFSVAMVNAKGIIYENSYGYEDISTKKVFSNTQRFNIASISKTFIGISLMKLIEQNKLTLSTPINDILPFQVVNPHFPESVITIEHLATHTSAILYGNLESKSWYLDGALGLSKKSIGKSAYKDFSSWSKNSKAELGGFLRESLTEQGAYFSKDRFAKRAPGTQYEYSNLGAALAAYIIELKTGVPYDEYIQQFVVRKFGFDNPVWKHTAQSLPTSYFQTKVEIPSYLPILYPTGGMMLSCKELSSYLIEMIKGFNGQSEIMEQSAFQRMMTSTEGTPGENGIFWELNGDKAGHNGANYGTTCFMSFNKKTGIGKIFMTNISSYKTDAMLKQMIGLWRKMAEFEPQLN